MSAHTRSEVSLACTHVHTHMHACGPGLSLNLLQACPMSAGHRHKFPGHGDQGCTCTMHGKLRHGGFPR